MDKIRVLLAGESWVSNSTHYKGWDFFSSTVYETGIEHLQKALDGSDVDLVHLPGHLAPKDFPLSLDELSAYDVVVLSDIGANSLLLHPDTWLQGKKVPNRLSLLRDWVKGGGGLAMCGGYYSFAGIYAASKYYRTAVEEVLPVNIYTFDDRVEMPEGGKVSVLAAEHPILQGISGQWPDLLGLNELTLKEDAQLLTKVNDYPLLSVRNYGKGRSMAWASDIGPHWCPLDFVTWDGYGRFWQQSMRWLAGKI